MTNDPADTLGDSRTQVQTRAHTETCARGEMSLEMMARAGKDDGRGGEGKTVSGVQAWGGGRGVICMLWLTARLGL